jgi:antitoxin HigA-1
MSTKNKGTKSTEETLAFLDGLLGPATLGNTLNAIRLSDELTQREFSAKLEISTQHLSDIENERRWVSPEKAQEFAKKLGYLAEDFVQLALQDSLNRVGIDMEVSVTSPAPRKKRRKKPTGSTTSAR